MPLPPGATDYWGALALETPAPLQAARYVRNGMVPHAQFETELAASINFAAASRPKEMFRFYGNIPDAPSSGGGGERSRWRFASHTGPRFRQLRVTFLLARQTLSDSNLASAKLYITNADASTTYSVGEFAFGTGPGASSDTPADLGWGEVVMTDIPADTDIYGQFVDVEGGRLISATVAEDSLALLTPNNYVLPSAVAVKGPIYDSRFESMLTLARDTWSRGAAQLANWTSDTDATAPIITDSTYTNIVDATSTTVSAATPGYCLDLRYCRTRTRDTVPCKLFAYGSTTTGSPTAVGIHDSSGALLGAITGFTTTPTWRSTTIDMPAAEDKYDLMFKSGGAGADFFSLYATSLYQYAT
jgi:hypothetical protein